MLVVEKKLGIPAEKAAALRTAEVWYAPDDQVPVPGYDILCFNQCAQPADPSGKPFLTLHLRLDVPEPDLLARLDKDTQYEIRRCARTDNLQFHDTPRPNEDSIADFLNFYRRFSQDKGLERTDADCAWYAVGLRQFHAAGGLTISSVALPDGQRICMHTYLVDGVRARLLNSASVFRHSDSKFRALVGRANRALHWHDMLFFKNAGYQIYDFGGITTAPDDTISKFKGSFGGSAVTEYNFVYKATSVHGRAAMNAMARAAQAAADINLVETAGSSR